LPAALEQVAAELRGGGTVAGAVDRLAAGAGAVAADLRRVHGRTQLGLPLADALAGWPAEHDAAGVRAAAGALAVATTMGGRAADAIDHLRQAIDLWEGCREMAKGDPDFDPIRGEPEFEELIGR